MILVRDSVFSMKYLASYFLLFVVLLQCSQTSPRAIVFAISANEELDAQLREKREKIRSWSYQCMGSASKLVGPDIPELRRKCSLDYPFTGDGDSTLWNGLLCSTGKNPWACEAVARSIDENGKVYRSPRRKLTDNDGNPYPQAPFSRDMARGVLLYLIETRDANFFDSWGNYISRVRGLCEDHSDLSCDLRNEFLNQMNAVAEEIGADTLSPCNMPVCMWPLHPINEILHMEVHEMRARQNASFHLHLLAIDIYLNSKLEEPRIGRDKRNELACKIAQRRPAHLFYQYLCTGATDTLKKQILELAPDKRPAYLSQWVWEREIPSLYFEKLNIKNTTENHYKAMKAFAAKESMGWDFIFLIDLLIED